MQQTAGKWARKISRIMLDRRPGCYLFLTQGESAGLHHPGYDFNDDVAPIGASFFARIGGDRATGKVKVGSRGRCVGEASKN